MSQISIKVENLSKAYQIGEIGTGTISHDLERWFAKIRGKEDPFLKIGEKMRSWGGECFVGEIVQKDSRHRRGMNRYKTKNKYRI
jgi:hypothetical protein